MNVWEKNLVIFPKFSLGGQIFMGFPYLPKNSLGLPLDAQKFILMLQKEKDRKRSQGTLQDHLHTYVVVSPKISSPVFIAMCWPHSNHHIPSLISQHSLPSANPETDNKSRRKAHMPLFSTLIFSTLSWSFLLFRKEIHSLVQTNYNVLIPKWSEEGTTILVA